MLNIKVMMLIKETFGNLGVSELKRKKRKRKNGSLKPFFSCRQ